MSPRISVLLAHYAPETQDMLSACLKSLSKQDLPKDQFEVILVSSNHIPQINLQGVVDKEFHSSTRLHYPAAIAKAYELSDPKSEYLFLLNDDVILSKQALVMMLLTMEQLPEIILGAKSNCGPIMGMYHAAVGYLKNGKMKHLGPQFRYHDIAEDIDDMIEHALPHPMALFPVPFCALFATMIKRSTYEHIGRIDTNLRTGFDDTLLAHNARKHGVGCWVALHAAVFHASGNSADLHLSKEDRDFNKKYFGNAISEEI